MENTYENLQVGDSFEFERTFSQEEVDQFAALTGDDNPLHVDAEYAKNTRFETTVVHGVFLMSIFSKILGRDFPGPGCIAVNLSSRFLRPVPIDSVTKFEVKVAEKLEKHKHVKIKGYAYVNGKMAMGCEATLIPPAPSEAS